MILITVAMIVITSDIFDIDYWYFVFDCANDLCKHKYIKSILYGNRIYNLNSEVERLGSGLKGIFRVE